MWQQKDVFEQIVAKEKRAAELEQNPAPVLPDVVLEWDKKAQRGFKPATKITTQKQLDEELVKTRNQYALSWDLAQYCRKPVNRLN